MKELEVRQSKDVARGQVVIVVNSQDAKAFAEFMNKIASTAIPEQAIAPEALPGMLSYVTIGDMLAILKRAGEGPKCEQCKGTGICTKCMGKSKECNLCQGKGTCVHCNGTGQATEPVVVENKTPDKEQVIGNKEIRKGIEKIRDAEIVDAEVERQRLNELAKNL